MKKSTDLKKFLFIIAGVLFFSTLTNAQYRINKTRYDYRAYSYQVDDPYNPAIAGVLSFLIPGLGQMVSGEFGRGAAFLAGEIGFGVICMVGVVSFASDLGVGLIGERGIALMWIGLAGMLTVDIWSVVDAVRVARVNNLAFRDKSKTSLNLHISPYFSASYYSNGKPVTGLSMKFSF